MTDRSAERKPLLPRIHTEQVRDIAVETRAHAYPASPTRSPGDLERVPTDLKTVSTRAAWKVTAVLMFLGIFMVLVYLFDKGLQSRKSVSAPPLGLPKKVQKRWGQYSPYMPAGKYPHPPSSCEIDQVNIVGTS